MSSESSRPNSFRDRLDCGPASVTHEVDLRLAVRALWYILVIEEHHEAHRNLRSSLFTFARPSKPDSVHVTVSGFESSPNGAVREEGSLKDIAGFFPDYPVALNDTGDGESSLAENVTALNNAEYLVAVLPCDVNGSLRAENGALSFSHPQTADIEILGRSGRGTNEN